jgi:hypothetical protein
MIPSDQQSPRLHRDLAGSSATLGLGQENDNHVPWQGREEATAWKKDFMILFQKSFISGIMAAVLYWKLVER